MQCGIRKIRSKDGDYHSGNNDRGIRYHMYISWRTGDSLRGSWHLRVGCLYDINSFLVEERKADRGAYNVSDAAAG